MVRHQLIFTSFWASFNSLKTAWQSTMAYGTSKSVRFGDECSKFTRSKGESKTNLVSAMHGRNIVGQSSKKADQQLRQMNRSRSLKARVLLYRVFSEDYERVKRKIFDPQGPTIRRWNKIFLISCFVSLFVDPLFFYLPEVGKEMCIYIETHLVVALTAIRSVSDVFYIIQMFFRFRTAYIAPSSRVFGRGELVIDPSMIASGYLIKDFWIDLVAALPLPQVLIWVVIPNLRGSTMTNTKNILRLSIIFQYIPRLFLIFPLSEQIVNATGVVTETAWAGAAYNLTLYMLASHVVGACWYLLSIERQDSCWRKACNLENPFCHYDFFDCKNKDDSRRVAWFKSSNVTNICNLTKHFQFGIYADALTLEVTSSAFFNKYLYCLWWGLRNLSSLGQNLGTSTYVGEIIFAIVIVILGLVLFALLIGNMQTYLQSTTARLEEWRIRRTDAEQWMHHRQLPQELRQRVRKYDQYKWVTTRGVDEEVLLKDLPMDLRRDIKRHLCLDLVRRVPLFDQMDELILDAICERLKPALCTEGTCLAREGDPVNEMLFIIRGHLDSYTTNGGRTGFFDLCQIGPGDFCGEELLTWALDPRSNIILPLSTRTVKAICEVEAFALTTEDMKFVASQFRRLHSKQLWHKFRSHSPQWRTWAACFIQAAWRRSMKQKARKSSVTGLAPELAPEGSITPQKSVLAVYAARLAVSTRMDGGMSRYGSNSVVMNSLRKPDEPDFS